jgi:hypothetical protein
MTEEARIVELAVQAAGAADAKWADRVVSLVPRVAAMFREPRDESDPNSLLNTARKVAEANVFTAEFRDYEYDDKGRDGNQPTHRLFVRLYDEKSQDGDYLDADGCQTVRTEPMWSATGRATRKILESMQSGQRGVFYRYTEQIDRKRKMGLLVHIEPLGHQTRPPASESGPPPARRDEGREAGEEPRPSPAVEPSDAQAQLAHDIENLTNKQKVSFVRACRADDITNPWEANAREMPIVRRHLEEARQQ